MKTNSVKAKEAGKKAIETTKKAAGKAANYVGENPKTVLYVGLGIVGLIVAYKFIKGFNAVTDVFVDDPNNGGGNIGDISNPDQTPTGATINVIQAQTAASTILSAVDGLGGLNEDEYMTIENVLRGKTPKDFQLISNAFGTPKRSPLTGEESFWFFGEALNLSQWLSIELDQEQKARLKQAAPLIFV